MAEFDIAGMLVQYICLLFALSVHEAAHAAMAHRCGDPSAQLMGRVTLNPLSHIDPIGTVVLPIIMMISQVPFLVGWARPVPFNPRNLSDLRRDPMLIALAGPGANLITALVTIGVTGLLVAIVGLNGIPDMAILGLGSLVFINFALLIFNLLPVPPLDGHHILLYFLPESGQRLVDTMRPFGIIIAILIINFTPLFGIMFGFVLFPVMLLAGLDGFIDSYFTLLTQ